MSSDRTIQRLQVLRESIAHASDVVSRISRERQEEVSNDSEQAIAEARMRPLPSLPSANIRAIMERYRRSRAERSPELTEDQLSSSPVPPLPQETEQEESHGDEDSPTEDDAINASSGDDI